VALSSLKQIFAIVATAALSYFAPGIGTAIAGKLGVTSGFLTSLIGASVLAVGIFAIQTVLGPRRGTDMEAGKVNVRMGEPRRWLNAGVWRQGGGVLFAEFDASGNFWFLVVHGDSILTNEMTLQYYLDDMTVTIDGSGVVQNKEFRLKSNKEKDPATVDGEGVGYVQIFTTTYTEDNPVAPGIAALTAACPQWTADEHLLAGTTYSVVKMIALPVEHRYKIYRWRGAIGIGEPAISVVGLWSNAYDPRDETQILGDRSTYKPTRNSALIWAWFRTHRYGRNKPESSINWDRVAEQADICDQVVTGIAGDQPRYECGIAIPEDKQRIQAEQEILLTMDGQLVFDDDGKCWARAGHWYEPTLTLYRNRDIVGMDSVEAQNGESETQGVIVRYTDPEANYSPQPSAAWINPLYYVEGETPSFLTVDVLACQNHNQAMRIAKGIGYRSQPPYKLAPTVGLRGLRAMGERIFELQYDNTFTGPQEIATNVEVDNSGMFCGFGCVPIDENRWTLLPGEENSKPVSTPGSSPTAPDGPTGVVLSYTAGRIEATFDAPTRSDVNYQFQYLKTADIGGGVWLDMAVQMADELAYSGAVPDGDDYTVRWRAITGSGLPSDWDDDTIDVPEEEIDFDGGDANTEV
jgi:hypothetical protein